MARWASSPQMVRYAGTDCGQYEQGSRGKVDSATVSDGPDGLKGVEGKDIIRGYNVIPAESEKAAEVIKFLDFIASDYKTLKLGFENEIWRWEEGAIVTDFALHDKHLYRGIYQSLVDVLTKCCLRSGLTH